MRSVALVLTLTIALSPGAALAQRYGGGAARGGGGGRANAPAARGGQNAGRGFNLSNDVPSTRQTGNRSGNVSGGNNNRYNNANANNRNNNANVNNRNNNANVNNRNNNANVNNRYNNANVNNRYNNANVNNRYNNANVNNRNVNVNNVNVNRNYNYTYNRSGYNGYGWHGAVVVNPVYRGPAWGWNRGVVWAPNYGYWGGGFWGAFAVGAATAAVMGSIYYNNQRYNSYQVSTGSPGAQLLSNYGLQQVPCGPPGLVVIYGPNNGVICANPNGRVAAGTYAVNENNLTLQSQ
jgi:hypothetical protein